MSDPTEQGNTGGNGQAGCAGEPPQALRRELWLDLEDTVITPVVNGWFNTQLINTQKIKDVITSFAPHRINIFSFAIWNQQERQRFDMGTREMMGIESSTVDFTEMSNFWSKQGAFRLCMRHHATNHRRHNPNLPLHVLLLDDAVYNETLRWPDLQTTVEQRNIDQL